MTWNMADGQMERSYAAFGNGDLASAEALALKVHETHPDRLDTLLMLGYVAAFQERLEEAESWFRLALRADPAGFEPNNWLASLLCRLGRFEEAIAFARAAVRAEPRSGDAHNNLGLAFVGVGKFAEAADCLREALRLEPPGASTLYNLGIASAALGEHREAAHAFEGHLKANPEDGEAWMRLAGSLQKTADRERALQSAQRASQLAPDSPEATLAVGVAWSQFGRADLGQTFIESVLHADPKHGKALMLLGGVRQAQGDFETAKQLYLEAIEANPSHAEAYYQLFQSGKVTNELDRHIQLAEDLVRSGTLTPDEQVMLSFGLGKAYDNLREYESAMRHFDAGNALRFQSSHRMRGFDKQAYSKAVDGKMALYRQLKIQPSDIEIPDPAYVLVVGMMRSGTTLMEQILSSHPDVAPGGEVGYPLRDILVFEGANAVVQAHRIEGERYRRTMQGYGPAKWIVDKMPGNYMALGVILTQFPRAKSIHMVRNPIDTCLSLWMTLQVRMPYSSNRSNTVHAYREYLRLMRYWREEFGEDRLISIRYEELVANRELELQRALTLCGLPWDASLMKHEKNDRTVVTPSAWQVRQPIYKTSVARWKNYEPWLGEFAELMEQESE